MYAYQDDRVFIDEVGDIFVCKWLMPKPINESYMKAKLVEYVGNNFAGSWPVEKGEIPSIGMRCYEVWFEDECCKARFV